MRKISHKIFLFMLCSIWVCVETRSVHGKQENRQFKNEVAEAKQVQGIEDTELYAKAAVLMDAKSGRVLYGKNQAEKEQKME